MIKFETLNELKQFISSEVFLTSEAAKFLNISNQRLNQLVQTGKLTPIKSTRAGSLFLKTDLEDRLNELSMFETDTSRIVEKSSTINTNNTLVQRNTLFGNDPQIITEAINYFSIQALLNNSMKKTKPVFELLSQKFDLTIPILKNLREISSFINISEMELEKSYVSTKNGFELLDPNDLVIKFGQELYPKLLEQTEQAPPFIFMRGNPNLLQYDIVSVVGTREPSEDGKKRAHKLSALLGRYKIVVASGLAKGIDRCAHEAALENGKPTIAVIGTPLTKKYPKENSALQQRIGEEGLIISQFPPSAPVQRWNFPLRNSIMSGISLATVIIEAGETSGALIQADYALKQERLVFIPQSALDNPKLAWPKKYIQKEGAANFSRVDELISKLENSNIINKTSKKVITEQLTLFDSKVGIEDVHRSEYS